MAAFKKCICLGVCALFVCIAFREALACDGTKLEKIVEILKGVNDWKALAGYLNLGQDMINGFKTDCQRESDGLAACYRRELVKAYCHKTGKHLAEVAHDIAHILEGEMGLKNPADRLRPLFSKDNIYTGHCKQDTHSPALFCYADFLRNVYTIHPDAKSDKWPPTPSTMYIKLALVKKEKVSRAENDSFTHLALQGDIDTVPNEQIEMDDILKAEDKTRLVVVEGAPGIGKSTFAWELSRQWSILESLKRFSLVVLLRLREEGVQTAIHITDLLYHHDSELRRRVGEEVERREGEGVLFVFDGFDEFPAELREKSLVTDIISGSTYLPRATVLVTSRPSATAQLQSLFQTSIGKHIEIVGFSEREIHEYAESAFRSGSETLASFKTYLSANPVVKAMMYNPLNSAIVVAVYRETSESDKHIPRTQTQLYTELTLWLLSRHLSAAGDSLDRRLPDRLEDIPHDNLYYWVANFQEWLFHGTEERYTYLRLIEIGKQLFKLGKLAFEGRVREEVIFEELPEGCSDLGLLVEHRALYTRKETKNYNFVHLTLQEYLGAFYISQLPASKQRTLFIEHIKSEHLRVVWSFVAGLTRMQNIRWDMLTERESKVEGDQVVILPFFIQFFYEAQDEQICKSTFSQSKVKYVGNINSPLDAYSLGYSISACRNVWDVSISGNNIIPKLMEMLMQGLKSIKYHGGYILHLALSGISIGDKGMEYLRQVSVIKYFKRIQTLRLSMCNISGEHIMLPNFPKLIYFDLSNNSVRQEDQFMTKPEVITPRGPNKQKVDYILSIRENWIVFNLVLAICTIVCTILCVPKIRWLKQELMIEHKFICTHTGHTYWDEKNEVLIHIPPKAVPKGVFLDIDVNVSLYGPFQYLEGLQPISPVVWMCAKGHEGFQFLKPVRISLPHYLKIDRMEDCEPLGITLLKSDHKRSKENKYLLTPTDMKLEIDPDRKRNLTFKTNHFCHLCLAAKETQETISKAQYCCTEVQDPKTLYFYFYVSYDLPKCLQLIEEKYANMDVHIGDLTRFSFTQKKDQVSTLYLYPHIQAEKGWKVVVKHPGKKITTKDIEFWGKGVEEMKREERLNLYPPRFKVMANGKEATEDCHSMIRFVGDIPDNFLDTNLDLRKPVKHHAPLPQDTRLPTQHSTNLLGIYDLQEVLEALVDVNQKWKQLGLALGVKHPTLAGIEKKCGSSIDDCKMDMLTVWLEQNDGCSNPSWITLVEALRKRTVKHPLIADAIEKKD